MSRTERPLEFSDIVSEHHAAILADPYGFLGLPNDAPLDVVRGVYISKAKLYHPDMIDPKIPSVEAMRKRLLEKGESLWDFLREPSSLSEDASEEDKNRELKERYAKEAGVTVQDLDNQSNALRAMQVLAHNKMIEINVAYEAITKPLSQRLRESIAGYRIVDMVEDPYAIGSHTVSDGGPYQQIDLEGQAQIHILSKGRKDVDQEYTVPGAYLRFDWGPPREHRWITWEDDYAESEHVKNLFINHELNEGREKISPVLLEPFFNTFNLDANQRVLFNEMLVKREDTEEMLGALGIKDGEFPGSESYRYLRFDQHVNGMMYLNHYEPQWRQPEIPEMRIEDGKIKLKAYTETVLSESDTILLQTIAYGPMLTQPQAVVIL